MRPGRGRLTAPGYARAAVLWNEHRFDEALRLIRSCGQTFASYGDTVQRRSALTLEAGILFQRGDIREARNLTLHILEQARSEGDIALQARLCANLGHCNRDLGDHDSAGSYYLLAVTMYDELRMTTESVRLRRSLGELLAQTGKFADALNMVTRTEKDFEQLGMTADAGMVALLRAEILLALGRPDEAAATCVSLPDRFAQLGASAQVLQAVSFLKDLTTTGRATAAAMRHVRTFLEKLPAEPTLLFAPPPG